MPYKNISRLVLTDPQTGQAGVLEAGGVKGVELDDQGNLVINIKGVNALSDAVDEIASDATGHVAASPKAVATVNNSLSDLMTKLNLTEYDGEIVEGNDA